MAVTFEEKKGVGVETLLLFVWLPLYYKYISLYMYVYMIFKVCPLMSNIMYLGGELMNHFSSSFNFPVVKCIFKMKEP